MTAMTLVLPESQHAWEATFRADALGRPLAPRFQRLIMLDAVRRPTRGDADRLEGALRSLEEEFSYGPEGLLTCLGWGPGWFERHTRLRSPIPRPVPMARWEDPVLEDFDACLHLASDDEGALAAVTERLFGPGAPDHALRLREVRTGFVGSGLPADRWRDHGVPDRAPLMMGFHSGLRGNQASEDQITIPDGPLQGGTTMHVSRIALDLDAWYAQTADARTARMYSPHVTTDQADRLVDDATSNADALPATAASHGLVGHAQATGRARLYGRPRINRRDFATVDDDIPGTHFVSLQRALEDFNATRAVMNAADAPSHDNRLGIRRNNGINEFMEVRSRATFAVPPRSYRAFPFLDINGPRG